MTRIAIFAAASAIALGLAACDDRGGAPVDAPDPAPLAELAAPAADLPYAEPAPVQAYAPERAYAWAERAYGLQRAVYDTPPDYGFDYDDGEPMVWETQDDWSLYAEPYAGDYRYYYYEPGAAYPYFVRDHDHGYAYDGAGRLVAMFDSGGRYLPRDTVDRYAPVAGRYYVRGRDLRNAGLQAHRNTVTGQAWALQAPRITRSADPWLRAAREDRQWRDWRERDRDRELARFQDETRRRQVAEHRRREAFDRREVAELERRDARPDAQAARQQRQTAPQERRGQREDVRQDRHRAAAQADARQDLAALDRRQAQQQRPAQAQQQRARHQARNEQRQQQAQADRRRQAQATERQQRRQQMQQARAGQQAERQRQVEAERQQAPARRQQQAQAERRPSQPQRQQQAQAQRQQAQRQQARAAEQQGRPAATRERGPEREKRRDPDARRD